MCLTDPAVAVGEGGAACQHNIRNRRDVLARVGTALGRHDEWVPMHRSLAALTPHAALSVRAGERVRKKQTQTHVVALEI